MDGINTTTQTTSFWDTEPERPELLSLAANLPGTRRTDLALNFCSATNIPPGHLTPFLSGLDAQQETESEKNYQMLWKLRQLAGGDFKRRHVRRALEGEQLGSLVSCMRPGSCEPFNNSRVNRLVIDTWHTLTHTQQMAVLTDLEGKPAVNCSDSYLRIHLALLSSCNEEAQIIRFRNAVSTAANIYFINYVPTPESSFPPERDLNESCQLLTRDQPGLRDTLGIDHLRSIEYLLAKAEFPFEAWGQLGLVLNVDDHKLDHFRIERRGDHESLIAVLEDWLKHNPATTCRENQFTWQELLYAIQSIGHREKADNIATALQAIREGQYHQFPSRFQKFPKLEEKVTRANIFDLRAMIQHCSSKWLVIGLRLGLTLPNLRTIQVDHRTNEDRLSGIIRQWVNKTSQATATPYGCTWRTLIEVLYSVGSKVEADLLCDKVFSTPELPMVNLPERFLHRPDIPGLNPDIELSEHDINRLVTTFKDYPLTSPRQFWLALGMDPEMIYCFFARMHDYEKDTKTVLRAWLQGKGEPVWQKKLQPSPIAGVTGSRPSVNMLVWAMAHPAGENNPAKAEKLQCWFQQNWFQQPEPMDTTPPASGQPVVSTPVTGEPVWQKKLQPSLIAGVTGSRPSVNMLVWAMAHPAGENNPAKAEKLQCWFQQNWFQQPEPMDTTPPASGQPVVSTPVTVQQPVVTANPAVAEPAFNISADKALTSEDEESVLQILRLIPPNRLENTVFQLGFDRTYANKLNTENEACLREFYQKWIAGEGKKTWNLMKRDPVATGITSDTPTLEMLLWCIRYRRGGSDMATAKKIGARLTPAFAPNWNGDGIRKS